MRDKKILSGVLSTAFCLSMVLGPQANAFVKNDLSSEINERISKANIEKAILVVKPNKDKILEKYKNAHSLTDSQLVELLKAVGFKGKALKTAWSVAKAESNGRPFAFNGNASTGDSSFGIFQINMLGTLGPDRRNKYDLDFNAYLFNPVMNAEIVYRMTKGGTDWSSWSSYNKGAHYKWMNKFPE